MKPHLDQSLKWGVFSINLTPKLHSNYIEILSLVNLAILKNPLNKSAQTPLRSVLCKLLISVLLDTNWKALIATVAKELILAADLRTLHA